MTSADTVRSSWKTPSGTVTPLHLFNSLTKKLEPLVVPESGVLRWYQCGPTVYDVSHLGHARTYIACDIIRRVIEDYFRIPVSVVMNVTDIDDKIILKARDTGASFSDISSKFELEYFKDMEKLNVKKPHVLTRVSEYVPEIINFIQRIISNGIAYESNNSVYFSVSSFVASGDHYYGRLEPESVGNSALLNEAEGSLASNLGKRNPNDFALWKAAKEGEPSWDSPWGQGRPGWHIECSAMCSEVLGNTVDIHLGGEDLRFPHHDNELAQSEACLCTSQWCNYFIHAGTLLIGGQKMSKSLKNFTTIRDAISQYSPRLVRLFFVSRPWDSKIDWSAQSMDQVVVIDKQILNFYQNISIYLRTNEFVFAPSKPSFESSSLYEELISTKSQVHSLLCQNVTCHEVISVLTKLINKTNSAMAKAKIPVELIKNVYDYINSILVIFGLDYESTLSLTNCESDRLSVDKVLDILSSFRGKVRFSGLSNDVSSILALCDSLRSEVLLPKGVALEDRDQGECVWKMVDYEEVLREKKRQEEAEQRKNKSRDALQARIAEKAEKAKISPTDLVRDDTKYSQYDETGMPTHDLEGNLLSKNAKKKLQKLFDAQVELHGAYLASLQQ
ncbi:hypothetical protein RCL1_007137 [Eukaryota sp. TZLM3-RCL]